ncbi:MAG: hypothetical protein OXU21_07560 [Chloroflexota bacterium]|nr:hypothetical protein [Chloroflexota bacterium]
MTAYPAASRATLAQSSGLLDSDRFAAVGPPRDIVKSVLPERAVDVDARVMDDPVVGARRVLPNLHAGAHMR